MDNKKLAKNIGKRIQLERKAKKISQYELAKGICAQSMISSIENGTYVPNVILLSQICKKLNYSLDSIMLNEHFAINNFSQENKKIETLCNNHKYKELINYMNSSKIINKLHRDDDFQKYYYYYGCATYQINNNTKDALIYLQMALNYTVNGNKEIYSSIELLLLVTINFIKDNSYLYPSSNYNNFELAITSIKNKRIYKYDENLGIIFYLYALSLYKNNEYDHAIKVNLMGINWIVEHNLHFMLPDLFFLLSYCYSKKSDYELTKKYNNNAKSLSEIFNQPIYKNI